MFSRQKSPPKCADLTRGVGGSIESKHIRGVDTVSTPLVLTVPRETYRRVIASMKNRLPSHHPKPGDAASISLRPPEHQTAYDPEKITSSYNANHGYLRPLASQGNQGRKRTLTADGRIESRARRGGRSRRSRRKLLDEVFEEAWREVPEELRLRISDDGKDRIRQRIMARRRPARGKDAAIT